MVREPWQPVRRRVRGGSPAEDGAGHVVGAVIVGWPDLPGQRDAFGLSRDLFGEPLVPIGTVYDPFVLRGLDAFLYSAYSGARFIVAGRRRASR